jgi:putative FmdB family regulatory protein
MPLYDFKCEKCGIEFEQIVVSAITMVPCRECAAAPATRQLSAPGGIRANGASGGMVLSEKQMKMIKEPVWQDEKTGAITSAH